MPKPCDAAVKTKAYMYLTLTRPQLEYASAAWNPHDNKLVNKLEQVQKNVACFVTDNYLQSTSFSELVSSLGWCTLGQRCLLNMALKLHLNLLLIRDVIKDMGQLIAKFKLIYCATLFIFPKSYLIMKQLTARSGKL